MRAEEGDEGGERASLYYGVKVIGSVAYREVFRYV